MGGVEEEAVGVEEVVEEVGNIYFNEDLTMVLEGRVKAVHKLVGIIRIA